MKAILRGYGIRMNTEQRQVARASASDMVRTRGVARTPGAARDLIPQPAPRGIFLSWSLPAGMTDDIAGWRVYKDDEKTLYVELHDRGSRQHFIETTAGATPPVTNLFVSSINALGVESRKVQIQGTALPESGAPAMPSSPPGYTSGRSGGGNTGGGTGGGGNTA